jgi:wobble nucleotide-excising tRNase
MKISKIQKIKEYKSFRDFHWHQYFNAEVFHDDVNLLFGENGSGKTSICNILKDVSGDKKFTKYSPEEASILIDNNEHKYSDNSWNQEVMQGNILFFDKEFVNTNVHLGHDRGTLQGQQEQESGKMIIEFDGEAISLREAMEKLKKVRDEEEKKVKRFKNENESIFNFCLTHEEKSLFQELKDKNRGDLKKEKPGITKTKEEIERKLGTDQNLQKKVIDIQGNIVEIGQETYDFTLSGHDQYQAIFNYDLKEQVGIEAEKRLISKIKDNKEFFELGFEVRTQYPEECPFCQSKNDEKGIKRIIKMYDQIYDDTYKKQQNQFMQDKQELVNELEEIAEEVEGVKISAIFLELKKLDQNYKIKNIYSVEEEEDFKKPKTKKIKELKSKLEALKKPNKMNVSKLYEEVNEEIGEIKSFFDNIGSFVQEKNKLIVRFKEDNTDIRLQERINKNIVQLETVDQKLDFINDRKVEKEKQRIDKEKELIEYEKKFEESKVKYRENRDKYETYCSEEAFSNLLGRIERYFKKFNFNFSLELDRERKAGATKEFPFAFKVLDLDGNERDFKEGLSEGEWQVLSLCFFFAFLDIQENREDKILVFDDPITSLDDSNLSSLVDLISDEKSKFSQTFILTHHRTFFKFLRKKFREHKKDSKEYNILRNKNEFGGSFICKSKDERFVEKLKNFEQHLLQIAQGQVGFDVEAKIIEYGQYLRYEIEHFIKCKLLCLDQIQEFTKVIEGIKNNKKIDDEDLDKIKQIYSFCNWTTSHVDVGDDHGLAQLKEKILEFTLIYDKL